MGVTSLLHAIARRAEPCVFPVVASGSVGKANALQMLPGVRFVATPRAANVLLIAGALDDGLVVPALVAHDALASPRATLWWRLDADAALVKANFPDAVVIDDPDPVPALRRVHEELVMGVRQGEANLLPDVEPTSWRGVGPYGQGGKGMTGGFPYGRTLAERADDRDGLKLDRLSLRVGPLFAPFPVGLTLDVTLQGDVIQQAVVENLAAPSPSDASVFDQALYRPVAIRDLELERARSHLRWVSAAVALAGTRSLAARILRLARALVPGEPDPVRDLERSLKRRGFLTWHTRSVGMLEVGVLHGVTGPVARASGVAADARLDDDAYRGLGFEVVTQTAGDAAARWVQRLREAAQALDMAGRAGEARAGGTGTIESPRGTLTRHKKPSRTTAALIPSLVEGMEWGDAVTTIVSLDLDMAEAQETSETRRAS